jgi:benzylsuccinate CoA-transferase BbsF subunit
MGLIAVLGALEYRHRTGKGQHIDLSQYECGVYMLSPVMLRYVVRGEETMRKGNRCDHAAPHGAYPCQGDDRWCVIAVNTDNEWQSLCAIMERPDLAGDNKFATLSDRKMYEDDLDSAISDWTRTRTAEEIITTLQQRGIESGVVSKPSELFNDHQLKHRHHYPLLKHPEIGKHHYEQPAYRLSLTPGELYKPAPCLGEHTEYVLRDILKISQAELAELQADGAID